jgi:hypothetical protein
LPYLFAPEECDDGDKVAGDSHEDENDAAGRREVQQSSRVTFKEFFTGIPSHSSVDS